MNRYQIKEQVMQLNGELSQREAAKIVGCTQSEIARCCNYFGIDWIRRPREQRGRANHNYKNGLGRSTIERTTRRVILEKGGSLFQCERCQYIAKTQELPRHHIDRNRANNASYNITVLCWSCHNEEHMPERRRGSNGRLLPKQDMSSR